MSPRKRVLFLVAIMVIIGVVIETVAIGLLYNTAMREERSRLRETAQSQARLIEAIARFDARFSNDYPSGPTEATLSQVIDAHNHYDGFGETGEFTLSKRKGNQIIFLLNHRHFDLNRPKPVAFDSRLAEPMRLALSGQSGTIIGIDYRGETVLAAYEPVGELNLGIVAKVDISEIRNPFIRAASASGLVGIAIIIIGVLIFFRVTNPLIEQLQKTIKDLQGAMSEIKTLRGIIPICASCKNIRDEDGYWKRVEEYIGKHTEAAFSHGICQKCAQKLYPQLYPTEKTD